MGPSDRNYRLHRKLREQEGNSLLEVLVVIGLGLVVAGISVPSISVVLDDARAVGAAKYLAGRFNEARMMAVARSAAVGFRFEPDGGTYRYTVYVDGNGNGIRSADIARGVDRVVVGDERLADKFPGADFGILPGVTAVESTEPLEAGSDPVRFGSADILTYTPAGTASSGTLYVRSASRQYAVRVLGATGRTRVLEFKFGERRWVMR